MLLWRLWNDLGCGNSPDVCQWLFWSPMELEILRHNDALNFPQIPRQWNDYPKASLPLEMKHGPSSRVFSYRTGIMLKITKQKSQGIWADPGGLRHQVRTKTKLSDLLTLLNGTLSEPEIEEQCLRVQWWGLYWDYNASVISLFLKIFKRRPILTQLGIKEEKKNEKGKGLYLCFYLLFLY